MTDLGKKNINLKWLNGSCWKIFSLRKHSVIHRSLFFHNDYIDFFDFEVKLNTFIQIQNGGSKIAGGSSSFFKDKRRHHYITAVVKGH